MFKRGAKRTRGGQAWDVSQMFKRYKAARGAEGAGIVFPGVVQRARLRKRNMRTAGFLGIETKFYDTGIAGTAIVATAAGAEMDPTPNILCLNAITQGDGESQRDGRKVILKSLQIKGMINADAVANAADPPAGRLIRILVVQDKQTNGAQLNSEDVIKDAGFLDVLSMRNLQYSKRFVVHYDKVIRMIPTATMEDGANTSSTSYANQGFKFFKNLNVPVNFTSTTEAIANITDNSFHVIALANDTGCNLFYQSRVRFVG